MSERRYFLNIKIDNISRSDALLEVDRCIRKREHSYIVFVNSDVRVKIENDPGLKRISDEADLTLVDGMPLLWISRIYGSPIRERVTGSDLVPEICSMAAQKGYTVFLLGGMQGVPEKAAENLKSKYHGIRIAGTYSPPYGFENDVSELKHICGMINDARPDVLIVSLGCPKQERFIYENRMNYDAGVSVCAGATMDFLAGKVKRCPPIIGKLGLEWMFRFMMEPRRLFKRYFVDDMRIFYLAIKYRPGKRGKRESG